jgi:hypothetical protein
VVKDIIKIVLREIVSEVFNWSIDVICDGNVEHSYSVTRKMAEYSDYVIILNNIRR